MLNWEQVFATRASRIKASEIRELLKLLNQPDIISFAGGIPDPALFPHADFQKAYSDIFASNDVNSALQYSVSEGYKPLRDWLVTEMEKIGIICDAENIFITSGSQQALDYFGKLFLSPADTALVAAPTYLGALQAFNAYEPVYDILSLNGNRTPASYANAAEQNGGKVKFAYVTAEFSNPTGETMDLETRKRLLRLAEELNVPILEDAAYQSLRYNGDAIAPILALEIEEKGDIEATRTIYCGSFSKTLAPGLRVGFVVANKEVIRKLVLIKQASDLHSSTINQMAIHHAASRIFDNQVNKLHEVYSHRRDKMLDALERHMPEGVEWTKPDGGMFIWVELPENLDGAELLAKSIQTEKVAFVPGKAFFANGEGSNTIRLSYSCANDEMIEEGIKRLARLIKNQA